ncbi:hypothetical protein OYC64_005433 [Pagothenia borchgrevinki]|uniref:Uncharacterized protein n=1 Tax=Pagothenia borchgrevinki TaxID=8213 RepID=A0ABD2GG85_PAGBO
MSYTANYGYQYVSVQRIKTALLWLQASNPYYADIVFNTEWLNCYEQDVNEQPTDKDAQPDEACVEEETSHDRQTHGMFMDTLLLLKVTILLPFLQTKPTRPKLSPPFSHRVVKPTTISGTTG